MDNYGLLLIYKDLRTGHSNYTGTIAFSPDGQWLASEDGSSLYVWSTTSWNRIQTLLGPLANTKAVAFSHDSNYLACVYPFDKITIWETNYWNISRIILGVPSIGSINSFAFSYNGEWLAVGGQGIYLGIWSTSDWSNKQTIYAHNNPIESITFSPNNQWLASGSFDNTIKIWEPTWRWNSCSDRHPYIRERF